MSPTRQAKGDGGKEPKLHRLQKWRRKQQLEKPDSVEGAVLLLQIAVNVVSIKITVSLLTMKYKNTAERKDFGGLQKMACELSQTICKDDKK